MTDWRQASIEELCSRVTSGGTPSRKRPDYYSDSEGIPWVKSQELVGRTITSTDEHISDAGLRGSSAKLLPPDTVLMAMYGANVGQLGYLGIESTVNQAICAMVTDPDVTDARFLYYALGVARQDLIGQAHGAAQQNLSQQLIKPFRLLVPGLPEQRLIGGVLGTIDNLIENNRRRVEVLEEMARVIYREWFVQFRYPGHETVVMVDSDLGPIPQGWSAGRVDSHLLLQRGFDLPLNDRQPGPIPVMGASGVQGSHAFAKASGPGVTTGRSGTVGVVTYVPEQYWPLNTSLWVKEFRLATPRYAYFLLSELDLRRAASGAAVPTLDRKVVHALAAICPPPELVERWDLAAAPLFDDAEVFRKQTAGLIGLRDLLLPILVTGQFDVSCLNLDALVEGAVA